MDSLHGSAPTDEELIALALDDEALPPVTQRHLEQCEVCQQRLARFQQTNASLVARLYRSQCPTGMQLSLYSAGEISSEDRQRIASHLLDCPLCMVEVEETRRFMQAQPVEFPVPAFAPHALVRRIFATLVKRPQMQFVVRGGAQETAWPRQYKAESVDLSLHLSRTSSGEHMLLGILTSADHAEDVDALQGVLAELYIAPLPVEVNGYLSKTLPLLQTRVDDIGNIVFKPVPAGNYVMVISLPGREMIIEGLTIEET
ncbi:MAG TPA: hypothetical protein VNE38_08350 [Ktedonobacteraceae bacterium]|nr:hypothetical protein [Ktedonobacteraceae bacterium]